MSKTDVKEKTLLQRAKEIKEYKPENSDEVFKVLDLLSREASKLDGVGGKMAMTQRQIFTLQAEAQGFSVRTDAEKAASQILSVGKLYEKMRSFSDERDKLRAEYRRIKTMCDAANYNEDPEQGTIVLNGSVETRRALA